jgi:hypothetical protein
MQAVVKELFDILANHEQLKSLDWKPTGVRSEIENFCNEADKPLKPGMFMEKEKKFILSLIKLFKRKVDVDQKWKSRTKVTSASDTERFRIKQEKEQRGEVHTS